jgi:hypothetical protein
MTTIRSLTLAAAVATALAAAGCGSKSCNDQTPPVTQVPTASCAAQTGAQVTVPMHVCPKCDQATPTCLVHAENAAAGLITLEPVSEVCDPNSSCPLVDPNSCPFATLNCQFTAPAAPGNVTVTIVTPGTPETFQLAVSAGGASPPAVLCSL